MRIRWLIAALFLPLPVAAEAQCPQDPNACGGMTLHTLNMGGQVNLGSWTTANRPTPAAGQFPYGYNSTIGSPEYWNGSGWVAASGGVPGGNNGQLQINNGGAFNGVTVGSGLSLSGSTLSATGTSPGGLNGQLQFNSGGVFSGVSIPTGLVKGTGSTLTAATAGADFVSPTGSGAGLTGLTFGQIGSTPTTLGGYGVAVTGTGNAVQATSPTITTPAIAGGTIAGADATGANVTPTGGTQTTLGAALVVLPTQRAPNLNDDSTQGHFVGEFWYTPTISYVASDVTPGNAAWTATSIDQQLPCDYLANTTGSVPAGAYCVGTIKLRAGYTGAAIHIAKSSADTTGLDIGFVNGKLDIASIWAYSNGAPVAVMTAFDQSGNANDCTAASFATAPQIFSYNTTGGVPGIAFNQPSSNIYFPPNANQVLQCSASFVANGFTSAFTFRSPTRPTPISIVEFASPATSFSMSFGTNTGINAEDGIVSAALLRTDQPAYANTTNLIIATNSGVSTTNFDTSVNGVEISTPRLAGSTLPTNAITTTYLGANNSSNNGAAPNIFGGAEFAQAIVWPATTTAAQRLTLSGILGRATQVASQVHDIIVFDGDSLTFGLGNPGTLQTLGRKLERFTPQLTNAVNLGTSGICLTNCGASTWLTQAFTTRLPPYFTGNARNKSLVLWAGTNDINATTPVTASTVYAAYQTYTSTMRSLVPGLQVYWITCIPRGSDTAAQTAQKAILNADLRAGAVPGGAILIDAAANPAFQNPNNTKYFFSDAIHLNDAGYEALMPMIGAALKQGLH